MQVLDLCRTQRRPGFGMERIGPRARRLTAPLARLHQQIAPGEALGRHPAAQHALRLEAHHLSREPGAAPLLDVLARRVGDTGEQRQGDEPEPQVRGAHGEQNLKRQGDDDSGQQRADHSRPQLHAFVELLALPIEEEHLFEMLLQTRGAGEVALERFGGIGLGFEKPARAAIRHLLAQRLRNVRRGHFERDGRRGSSPAFARPALGFGEHVEQAHAHVLVHQHALLGDGRRILLCRTGELLARIMDRAQGRVQPDGEERLPGELGLLRLGRCRLAMAREALAGARQHPGERHRPAAERVDGHVRGAGDLGGPIEAGEGLQLVPGGVASDGARRHFQLDVDLIGQRVVARQRHRHDPLDARSVVDAQANGGFFRRADLQQRRFRGTERDLGRDSGGVHGV